MASASPEPNGQSSRLAFVLIAVLIAYSGAQPPPPRRPCLAPPATFRIKHHTHATRAGSDLLKAYRGEQEPAAQVRAALNRVPRAPRPTVLRRRHTFSFFFFAPDFDPALARARAAPCVQEPLVDKTSLGGRVHISYCVS